MEYVVGHKNPDTDSICSAIAYADFAKRLSNTEVIPARTGELNPETEFVLKKFGFDSPELIKNATEGMFFTLVDHNTYEESIDGLKDSMIKKVIDHHKLKNSFDSPRSVWTEPWGATATMIAVLYKTNKIRIPKKIAGILLSAILSDTVVFKSPTTEKVDRDIAAELAKIAGVEDIEKFGIEIKSKKTDFSKMSPRQIITVDYKEFTTAGKKYSIGQVEVVDEAEISKRKEEILKELEKMKEEQGLIFAALMVTNIIKEGTDFWAVGNVNVLEKVFGKEFKNNSLYVEKVMSRKKQVIPFVDSVLTNM